MTRIVSLARRQWHALAVLSSLLVLSVQPARAVEPAEWIFSGGDIITVDARQSTAEAVAVAGGEIVAVGKSAEVLRHQGDATRVVDLKGRTLVPGFIDPHSHFTNTLMVSGWANVAAPPVGPVQDIAGLVSQLKQLKDRTRPAQGAWLMAWGYDPNTLRERRDLARDDLDAAFPDHPVMVLHVSLHGCVLNSAGLTKAGIDASTKTPAGGVIARKPGSNVPAGLLMENAFAPVFHALPRPTEDELLSAFKPAQNEYARNGYTTMQDGASKLADLAILRKAAAGDRLFLDLVALPIASDAPQVVGKADYTFGRYDKRLKLGGVKNITDGSPQGKTAFWTASLLTPGPGGERMWRGEPNVTQQTLTDVFKLCYAHDVQVYSHANGDAAIDMVIDAHRAASNGEKKDRRPVVIHSQFVRRDQLDSYVELGMIPSFFTNHAFFWGDVHATNLGHARASFLSPLNTAAKKSVRFTNHTDYIVTPLDPMFTIWTAVNRVSRSGEVIGPAERVAPMVALRAITIDAAYQYFEEQQKGSIEVGKLADLVILDRNPLKVDRYAIKDIKVVATIKEGRFVYGAP